MALTDPIDTLAFHQSRVLTTHRDMSGVPCSAITQAVSTYKDMHEKDGTKAESEALWFYGMNHGMALISANRASLEPLAPWELAFVKEYHEQLGPKAIKAFYYLFLICTREFRHIKSMTKDAPKIKKEFGEKVGVFLENYIAGGEAKIEAALLNNPPDVTLGTFVKSLQWGFYHSSWNGGYGGPAWGSVTDCLVRFVEGEFTAEMMLDTVWTLSHNNGPIFNKGFFYCSSFPHLIRVLDVQRAGQVPEGCLHDLTISKYCEPDLRAHMQALYKQFPGKLGAYVDWEVVEALGSVNKYHAEKTAQAAKYGLSPAAQLAHELANAKQIKMEEEKAEKALSHAKDWFQVMPGLEVKKIKMARAA